MKKLLLSLLTLIGFASFAYAEEVTFDFVNNDYGLTRLSGNTSEYTPSPSVMVERDATVTFTSDDKGYRLWSDGVRLYKDKNVKVAVSVPGGTISKVALTVKSGATFTVDDVTTGTYDAGSTAITWTADESAAPVDLITFAYSASKAYAVVSITVTYTTGGGEVNPPAPAWTFRRYSSDGSNRYYDNISYSVNGETKELYSVNDPRTEPYYVASLNGQWQNEGAYIDFTDKVIEVPADAENFTMILKTTDKINGISSGWSSKWSQNAVMIDWNKNGQYNEDGETNGVININKKANEAGGGLVATTDGETDVITLPAGLEAGQTYSMFIAMTEPKGMDGKQDLWNTNWQWTNEIFADGVCSLINGEVYELTVKITAPLSAPKPAELAYSASSYKAVTGTENELPTLANPNNLAVTYASSNEEVATINAQGEVTLVGAGTTTISATSEAADGFEAGSASYTLTVVKGCATLAEFLAATPAKDDVAVMNGAVTVVYTNGAYVYIKDETASSLIYKFGLSYKAGDVIPGGWEGKNGVYAGLYEIVPTGSLPEATAGEAPEIELFEGTVTTDMMNRIVKLHGVLFEATTPSDKTNFTGKYGEQTLTFRNNFAVESVDAGKYDVTVAVSVYNADLQLMPIEYTPSAIEKLSFRRIYTDNSSRYYNNISYTVNGETKVVYSVDDPRTEDYYVAPTQNSWQTEGAYIDFTDKVIEIPVDVENFTMILKSNPNAASSKWSQNAVMIDWNGNGQYNDEGETNGVININGKPNAGGNGGYVVTDEGDTDVITLPAGLQAGDTFSMLIAMTEPKGTDGTKDLWQSSWEWTKEIFADGVCSLINGQAYELTVKIVEPTAPLQPGELSFSEETYRAVTGADNEFPTLNNPNNVAVIYTSSNEEVATVAADGTITLIGAGETTITAASKAGQGFEAASASYKLTVIKGCATLAEFLAATPDDGDAAIMNGQVTVVYVNASYVYIKDETASSLIYKYNLGYEPGDIIPGGWEGKNSSYFGLYEIAPVSTMPDAIAGEAPEFPVHSGEVTTDMMNQVVVLKDVVFAANTPASKTSCTGVYGEQTLTFYNNFMISAVPAGTYDVKVAVAKRYSNVQLYPIEYIAHEQEVTLVSSKDFEGLLEVDVDNNGAERSMATVALNLYSDATYGIYLADFGGSPIDIRGLKLYDKSLSGRVEGLELYGGMIKADADVTGTYDGKDLELHLDIVSDDIPVTVDFSSKKDLQAIGSIAADGAEGEVEYYTIQGVRVAAERLTPGVYVARQGSKAYKVYVK